MLNLPETSVGKGNFTCKSRRTSVGKGNFTCKSRRKVGIQPQEWSQSPLGLPQTRVAGKVCSQRSGLSRHHDLHKNKGHSCPKCVKVLTRSDSLIVW